VERLLFIVSQGRRELYESLRVVLGQERGVEVILADDADCIALMARFIREKPELWNEDIMEGD